MSKDKIDTKFEGFFLSLKHKQHLNVVDKFGLQDTSIMKMKPLEYDFGVKELFIYTIEGILLLNVKFHPNYLTGTPYEKFNQHLKKLVKSLQPLVKNKNNISFHKVYVMGLKIFFLFKDGLIFTSVFSDNTNSYSVKLYLLHMYVAFINFNVDLVEALKIIFKDEKVDVDFASKQLDYTKYEFFQLKVYELYFVKHITSHFERVMKHLIRKEEMSLSYIKFKNMYVIDLSTQEIIFDMLAIRKAVKNKRIYKNEKLWQEIIHHSKVLMENYKGDYGNTFDNEDSFYRFVKFECTSTYPRLTFIVKFVPILKGISIIHMYSQKKLSRMSDNNDTNLIHKTYKEIDILYGAEIKNNTNIEFRYTEPKKLQEIEKFFIEFLILLRNNKEMFFIDDQNYELKYFDYSIISTINDLLINNKTVVTNQSSVDNIITKINNKLYENYLNMMNNGAEMNNKSINGNGNVNVESNENNNSSHLLLINKENILRELFRSPSQNTNYINNKSEYEIINENNLKYKKDKDGWLLRENTIEDVAEQENRTINFSSIENNSQIMKGIHRDISMDLSNKCSVIENEINRSDSIYFNKINSNMKKADQNISQTIDYLMNELNGGFKDNDSYNILIKPITPIVKKEKKVTTIKKTNTQYMSKEVMSKSIKNKLKIYDAFENYNPIAKSNSINNPGKLKKDVEFIKIGSKNEEELYQSDTLHVHENFDTNNALLDNNEFKSKKENNFLRTNSMSNDLVSPKFYHK